MPACSLNYGQLLKDVKPGGGQCGSFATLIMGALGVNGISSTFVFVEPNCNSEVFPCDDLLIVKNWGAATIGEFHFDSTFKYGLIMNDGGDFMVPERPGGSYGDFTNATGAAGQNSPTPSEKIFTRHFVVRAGAPSLYYDPSYGNGPFSSPRALESAELQGYARFFGDVDAPAGAVKWRAQLVDDLVRVKLTDYWTSF